MPERKEYISVRTNKSGHERWRDRIANESLMVHRLTAICHGEPVEKVFSGDYVVHHKNGIPWDNRPSNLKLMDWSEHSKHHFEKDDMDCSGCVTQDECEELRSKYPEQSMTELATANDLTTATIWFHLNGECSHNDVKLGPGWDGPRDGPWRDKKRFIRKYQKEGHTYSELADMWDCSSSTISKWAKEHGITE